MTWRVAWVVTAVVVGIANFLSRHENFTRQQSGFAIINYDVQISVKFRLILTLILLYIIGREIYEPFDKRHAVNLKVHNQFNGETIKIFPKNRDKYKSKLFPEKFERFSSFIRLQMKTIFLPVFFKCFSSYNYARICLSEWTKRSSQWDCEIFCKRKLCHVLATKFSS